MFVVQDKKRTFIAGGGINFWMPGLCTICRSVQYDMILKNSCWLLRHVSRNGVLLGNNSILTVKPEMRNNESYGKIKVRRVVPYTPGEQPDKENMIKLNTNENPYPPAPAVKRALDLADRKRRVAATVPESGAVQAFGMCWVNADGVE